MLSGGRRCYLTCRTKTKGLSSTCRRKVEKKRREKLSESGKSHSGL